MARRRKIAETEQSISWTWGTDDDLDFCPARRDDIPDDEQDYPPSPYMIDDEPYIIFD